jgi:acyl-CoA thioester hydrolase
MANIEDFRVIVEFPAAWGDMDALAHINNVAYFRYFENARVAYFERTQIMGSAEMQGGMKGVGPILANASCRFKAPMTYPDQVRVGIRAKDLLKDRFTMEFAVFSESLQRIAAAGEGLIVAYDYDRLQKAEAPERWRRAIAEVEGW